MCGSIEHRRILRTNFLELNDSQSDMDCLKDIFVRKCSEFAIEPISPLIEDLDASTKDG